jgi:hypothetical protein
MQVTQQILVDRFGLPADTAAMWTKKKNTEWCSTNGRIPSGVDTRISEMSKIIIDGSRAESASDPESRKRKSNEIRKQNVSRT